VPSAELTVGQLTFHVQRQGVKPDFALIRWRCYRSLPGRAVDAVAALLSYAGDIELCISVWRLSHTSITEYT